MQHVITRRVPAILVLLTLSTCDGDESDGAAACEPSEAAASVTVDNRSGLLVEAISATPCDGSEEQELTLPADGIAFASQATIELPGPGCWLLQWDGEGCRNEAPYRTSTDVCAGETYEWTISVDGRVCQTGW
jgi:hypothetical protein